MICFLLMCISVPSYSCVERVNNGAKSLTPAKLACAKTSLTGRRFFTADSTTPLARRGLQPARSSPPPVTVFFTQPPRSDSSNPRPWTRPRRKRSPSPNPTVDRRDATAQSPTLAGSHPRPKGCHRAIACQYASGPPSFRAATVRERSFTARATDRVSPSSEPRASARAEFTAARNRQESLLSPPRPWTRPKRKRQPSPAPILD